MAQFKADAAEAVVDVLKPVQLRRSELLADPAELDRIIARGAEKASEVAAVTVRRAKEAMDFISQLTTLCCKLELRFAVSLNFAAPKH